MPRMNILVQRRELAEDGGCLESLDGIEFSLDSKGSVILRIILLTRVCNGGSFELKSRDLIDLKSEHRVLSLTSG